MVFSLSKTVFTYSYSILSFMKSVKNFIADVKLSLLFTHVCPATGFCRCYAFQIGKICCRNCIVRNFQFRKFLPVNSYFLPAFSPCLTVPYANPFCPGKSFLFPISSQVIFQPSSHCPYFLSPLFIFFISQIIKSYSNPSGNVL